MNSIAKTCVTLSLSAVGLMPMVSFAAVAGTEQQATQQLVNLLSNLNSMTANFEQKTISTNTKSVKQKQSLTQHMNQTFTGQMKVERPGKFFWQTNSPAKQTIVTSGSTVLIYDPDLKQVIRKKLDIQVANTPALLLSGNTSKIMQTYQVTQPDAGKMFYTLYPKNNEGAFQSLWISFASNKAPIQMVLQNNMGQVTHIKFSQVKVNQKIPAATFNFTPPKGTDIIDQ